MNIDEKIKEFEKEKKAKRKQKWKKRFDKANKFLDKIDPNMKKKPKDPFNPTGINWD